MEKPPGWRVTPAASMRRRSCRGAGVNDRHAISKSLQVFLAADRLHRGARWRAGPQFIGSIFNAAIIGPTEPRSKTITHHLAARTDVRPCLGTHAAENSEAPLL